MFSAGQVTTSACTGFTSDETSMLNCLELVSYMHDLYCSKNIDEANCLDVSPAVKADWGTSWFSENETWGTNPLWMREGLSERNVTLGHYNAAACNNSTEGECTGSPVPAIEMSTESSTSAPAPVPTVTTPPSSQVFDPDNPQAITGIVQEEEAPEEEAAKVSGRPQGFSLELDIDLDMAVINKQISGDDLTLNDEWYGTPPTEFAVGIGGDVLIGGIIGKGFLIRGGFHYMCMVSKRQTSPMGNPVDDGNAHIIAGVLSFGYSIDLSKVSINLWAGARLGGIISDGEMFQEAVSSFKYKKFYAAIGAGADLIIPFGVPYIKAGVSVWGVPTYQELERGISGQKYRVYMPTPLSVLLTVGVGFGFGAKKSGD